MAQTPNDGMNDEELTQAQASKRLGIA